MPFLGKEVRSYLDEPAQLPVDCVHVLLDGEDDDHVPPVELVPDLSEGGVVLREIVGVLVGAVLSPGPCCASAVLREGQASQAAVVGEVGVLIGDEDDHLADVGAPADHFVADDGLSRRTKGVTSVAKNYFSRHL